MSTLSNFASGGLFGSAASVATGGAPPAGSAGSGAAVSVPIPGSEAALLADVAYTDEALAALSPQELDLRWDLPSSSQTVTLGGDVFQVQTTYRKRSSSWFLSLFDLEGTPILTGRRLSPGWGVNLGHIGKPEGVLLVVGSTDPYRRDDLGTRLRLTFYPRDGLIVPPPDYARTLVAFA